MLDHKVVLFLVFWGTSILCSRVAAPACIPIGHCFYNCECMIWNLGKLLSKPVTLHFSPDYFNFFFNVYFWERERKRAREGQERGKHRIHSRFQARDVSTEPDAGLELMNHEIMTWAKIKSQTLNRLSHPGTPIYHIFFIHSSVDGHLGSLHSLAIVDNTAINIGVDVPFQICIFVLFE